MKKLFSVIALSLFAAVAHAQSTGKETFENFPGHSYFIKAPIVAVHYGPLEIAGGETVTNAPMFGSGTVYGTAGLTFDSSGNFGPICENCQPQIGISNDYPFQKLAFDLIHGNIADFKNKTATYTIADADNINTPVITVHFSAPGQRQHIQIPWKTTGVIISGFITKPINAPTPDVMESLWMFAIDNVEWSFQLPLRLDSTGGIGPIEDPGEDRRQIVDGTPIDVTYPLGAPFTMQIERLQDNGTWTVVPAAYTIRETPVPPPKMLNDQLFPSHHVFFFGPNSSEDFKNFQTVHTGDPTLSVVPQPRDLPVFEVNLHIVRPDALGAAQVAHLDRTFSDVADEAGVPPQFLKAQAGQMSEFNVFKWKYILINSDYAEMHALPLQLWSKPPYRRYVLREPAGVEGDELCPRDPISLSTFLPHDCAFPGLDDISPRYTAPPMHYLRDCVLNDIAPGVDAERPLTMREIYNGNPDSFAGSDPSPQYGPTAPQNCQPVSVGRVRAVRPGYVGDLLGGTAQTPLASAYGLMQVVAEKVIRTGAWRGVNSRFNPSLLFDPFAAGTEIPGGGSIVPGVNTDVALSIAANKDGRDDISFDSRTDYIDTLRTMFYGYTGSMQAAEDILAASPAFFPRTSKPIFGASVSGSGTGGGAGCAAPSITSETTAATVAPGGSANLAVSATSAIGISSYQWYEGAPGDTHAPLANGQWRIVTVTPTHATTYWAAVRNGCGTTASPAIPVAVAAACPVVTLTQSPADATINGGQSVTLHVAADNATSYQWFIGQGPISTGADGDRSHPIPSSNTPDLPVSPTATTHYWAEGINGCGQALSGTATVTVTTCLTPSIAVQPSPSSIVAGQSAALAVSATGQQPLTITWLSSDGVTVGSGAQISVAPSASTLYHAHITNTCGAIDSAAVLVTVTASCQSPVVSPQPLGSTITAGQSATLSVSATGTSPLTIEWRTTTGATVGIGASITVSPTTTTAYFAHITNACGATDSATATVTVNPVPPPCDPPQVSAQPQGSTITDGQTATLSVSATGTAPLTIQWFLADGTPAGSGASITVSPAVTTTYFARISNACGTATSPSATITVTAPCTAPSITQQPPADTTITDGHSITLSVTAAGTAPLSYQWYNGAALLTGATTAQFTFTPHVDTFYHVVVTNACGSVQSAVALVRVQAPCVPPAVVTNPQGTTVTSGDPVTLSALGSGTNLTYRWFDQFANFLGTGDTITFTPAVTRSYYCTIANECGSVDTAQALVTVNPACFLPAITGDPQSTTISSGGSATLFVFAAGASVTFQWYTADGTAIPNATGSSLTVSPTTTTSYYAVATNPCGSARSQTATVTVVP